ncbi:sensor histidine kinase [Chitinophaga niabensis]|uniref:histidine kinase n=1 Tax=Chitinophaga niabensis TaxID=536979 RepID=A0A1N6K0H7_9BACT|nr:HAMP domain-containing sensor histidine kinase [Chitinophaga niabensis]SIO50078.1 Signal transduction histidine kinase [Chitinophaga niabensis]
MKLFTKLTLFITLSKTAIVLLFILLLPFLVDRIASQYNDYYLKEQKKKVLNVIRKNGVEIYLQGENSYGSYTMLKEEYISLEPAGKIILPDTIATVRRVVEEDTLTYRVLSHVFFYDSSRYILEIGKTTASIGQYNRPLQKMALYVLAGLIIFTILIDLVFTRLILRPLGVIIKTKLVDRKFPFKEYIPPIQTSTSDFKYLDDSLIELIGRVKDAFEKEREFTSNASHELMTPLSILQNKMENLIMEPELDEELHQKIMGMMKTLNRLKKIVSSLLFISRIENDQFAKSDVFSIHTLIGEIMEELGHRLEDKRLSFSNQLAENVKLQGLNHDLIFQLFYNLLNNAIRYNRQDGQITITGQITGDVYKVIVTDTGIGISPQEIGTIFNRFKKVVRTENEGYGLGLSIVKTIAEYHHLQLEAHSEPGKGTAFVVIFPGSMLVNN